MRAHLITLGLQHGAARSAMRHSGLRRGQWLVDLVDDDPAHLVCAAHSPPDPGLHHPIHIHNTHTDPIWRK